MKRRLAALLTCGLMAFGQRSSMPPTAVPYPWVIDAVAVDASGSPVTDLTAEDFEVVQGGRARQITNFTWFDTRLHTAVSRTGQAAQLPALDLLPDEIRRNLVVVVDDLGLSLAGINTVRSALKAFVGSAMSSGDRMAILRSSGGSGVLQQLTGDTRILVNAIDGIRYLGGSTSAGNSGSASWLALGHALEGLRDFAGRKVVVVIAENLGTIGPRDRAAPGEAAHTAHAAAAAVYAIHPPPEAPGVSSAAPGALESLAHDTGGLFRADFTEVLQNEQGYYAIGFQPEDNTSDPSASLSLSTPAVLKVRRPGVVVRSRAGFLGQPVRAEFPAMVDHSEQLNKALGSPFSSPDIRARLTAIFSGDSAGGPVVDAILHFDPSGFSTIHDLQDMYHVAVQLRVAAYSDDGRSTAPLETTNNLTLRLADYRQGIEKGLSISFPVKLPGPRAWQIRVVVADSGSDRIGSATQFIEIPNVKQGVFAISGLVLRGTPAADRAPTDPLEDPGVRIFKPGHGCTFQYVVFNPLTSPDKQSTLEAQTRIFTGGRVLFDGTPERVTFGEAPQGSHRQINGYINLDRLMAPGDYILQVNVRDKLAPPGQPRTATQFTDFQVRE